MFPALPQLPSIPQFRSAQPKFESAQDQKDVIVSGPTAWDFYGDLLPGGGGGGPPFGEVIWGPTVDITGGGGGGSNDPLAPVTQGDINKALGQVKSVVSWDIPWGRIAAFLLGLLLIAAGLYLSKDVRQFVAVGARKARGTATVVAETA